MQTIAELENHIEAEVDDLRQHRIKSSDLFFFSHYGHEEASLKDLALICFIKDVEFDERRPGASLEDLHRTLEAEAREGAAASSKPLAKTGQLVQAILPRVELLLRVSIDNRLERNSAVPRGGHQAVSASFSVDGGGAAAMSRSLQSWPSGVRTLKRSVSLEVDQQSLDDSILQIPKLRLKRTIRKMTLNKRTMTSSLRPYKAKVAAAESLDGGERPPQSAVLDQLFDFIGSHPEAAVSPWRFLAAVNIRRERSVARHYALVYMKQLLMAGGGGDAGGIPPHLVNSVASLLRAGPRLAELTCSGSLVRRVRMAYSEAMALVVQAAARQPLACRSAIGSLCTVPYHRSEEPCLVRSGLVSLLDRLCAVRGDLTGEPTVYLLVVDLMIS